MILEYEMQIAWLVEIGNQAITLSFVRVSSQRPLRKTYRDVLNPFK
jgi:hypothetical protein